MKQLLDGLFSEGGLLRVRSLLVLGGGGVASWLAIDGTLSAEVYLAALGTLAGTYVGGRIAQGGGN